jgi:hypothetical protein
VTDDAKDEPAAAITVPARAAPTGAAEAQSANTSVEVTAVAAPKVQPGNARKANKTHRGSRGDAIGNRRRFASHPPIEANRRDTAWTATFFRN